MNISNLIEANWLQLSGSIKSQWGRLTDNDLTEINGRKDKLVGKLIEKYELTKQEAEDRVNQLWQ